MSRLTQGQSFALPVRGCHPLRRVIPDASGCLRIVTGLVRVRSPLLAESRLMSFPPATEMFQFAGFASHAYGFSLGYPGSSPGWVAPFGDPGINDRSHLPRAFRSVPRPSSPLSAKASTRCPSFALEHRTQRQRSSRYQNTDIRCQNLEAANSPSQKTLRAEPTKTAFRPPRSFRHGHTTRFFTIVHQQTRSPP